MFAALNSPCSVACGSVSKVGLLRNLSVFSECVIELMCNVCERGQLQYLKLKTSQEEYKQVVILNKLYPHCPRLDTSNPKPPLQSE